MTSTSTEPVETGSGRDAPATADGRSLRGVGLALAGATSNQTGAAIGATAFDAIGSSGVVAIRQLVAASILLPTVRPPFRRFTWTQWWPVVLLAASFALTNLSLYAAIDRIGLGLAVTLEFLGPLAVALLGSHRRLDLACAVVAGIGVYVLVLPGPSTDVVGIGLGLLAGGGWASYILLNRLVGRRLPGIQATAAACSVSAVGFVPVVVVLALSGRATPAAVAAAATVGLLSSTLAYALDINALRSVPPAFFGAFMSVHPLLATLAGVVVLHQVPASHEVVGIVLVVLTNVVAVGVAARRDRRRRLRARLPVS